MKIKIPVASPYEMHWYCTRYCNDFKTHLAMKDTTHRSVKIAGNKLCNDLSNKVNCDVSFNAFKKELKKYILINHC